MFSFFFYSPADTKRTFQLVHPAPSSGDQAPIATNPVKFQAAINLARTAYRNNFKAQGVDHFQIVIHEKLSLAKTRGMTNGDPKFFSAYDVRIIKLLSSGYRVALVALKGADHIRMGVSWYNKSVERYAANISYRFIFVVKFVHTTTFPSLVHNWQLKVSTQFPPRGMPQTFHITSFFSISNHTSFCSPQQVADDERTFQLVHPAPSSGAQAPIVTHPISKFEAAKKLASDVYRSHFKALGIDHFQIVTHEKLSREKIEARGLTDGGDPKLFSAYDVYIKKNKTRTLSLGFKTKIFAMKHVEKADYIKMGVSWYNKSVSER
jgi:hypothetical protein